MKLWIKTWFAKSQGQYWSVQGVLTALSLAAGYGGAPVASVLCFLGGMLLFCFPMANQHTKDLDREKNRRAIIAATFDVERGWAYNNGCRCPLCERTTQALREKKLL